MSTLIDFPHRDHCDRHQLWDRFERAELFEQYLDLPAQGVSQRPAATRLQVPRSTLHAWHAWHDTLDICPEVAQFLQRGPGLAFLHRLVLALHLVCVEVGACGMRLGCLLLPLTGLDRFVAASYGAQQQVNHQGEHAIVDYRHTDTARLAKAMPRTTITVAQDKTFTGGLWLVATEPVSHCIILEHLAHAREQDAWHALMAPALAPLHCEVMPSTSDEAPGLLASVAHPLGAHHAPALFQVQHARSPAVCVPLATKERAADKALTEAREQLAQVQAPLESAGDPPTKRGPGRPPTAPRRLAHAPQALAGARREHERLAQQREQVTQSLQAIGQAAHFVDLARGVRRNGPRIAADIRAHMETIRTVAQHEQLRLRGLERLEKAERVVPNMPATMAWVSGDVRQRVAQLGWVPPGSYAMHAQLMPSFYLERVAQTRTVRDGQPLRALAIRLRPPLFEPGGALRQWRPETQSALRQQAKELAEVFQRSSASVEGRNGYLSLRNHQLRGLELPRKRACLTAMHNFCLTRPDGTTAAERFFGQKPRSMFAAILGSVDLPPAPRSPQRRF